MIIKKRALKKTTKIILLSIFIAIMLYISYLITYDVNKALYTGASDCKDCEFISYEIIEQRTEFSKKHYYGNGKYSIDSYLVPIHYKDNYKNDSESWKDIDLTITDNKVTKAPYILEIDNSKLTYTLTDKKTGDSLSISGVGDLELFNTGFRLVRQIDNPTELWKANANYLITQHGTGISINSKAYDATGKELIVGQVIVGNSLFEYINSKEFENVVYPIRIDPTIDIQVSSSENDGYVMSNETFFDNSADGVYCGHWSTTYKCTFTFFSGISGLNGTTIGDNTTISYFVYSITGTPETNVYLEDAESPIVVADASDYFDRIKTTAFTACDSFSDDVWNVINIKTSVQEIADSYDTSTIQVLHYDDGNSGEYVSIRTYDYSDHTLGAKLHIEYESSVAPPSVTTNAPNEVYTTGADIRGYCNDCNGANLTDAWFYVNGTTNYTATSYPDCTGAIWRVISGVLTAGSENNYYCGAGNSEGVGTGDLVYFATLPSDPSNLASDNYTHNTIDLDWTMGTGSENTTVRYRTDGTYPTSYTDGIEGYLGSDNFTTLSDLEPDTEYKIRIWSINTDYETTYSSGYDDITITTSESPSAILPPTSFLVTNDGAITTNISWIKGDNSTYTLIRASILDYPNNTNDGELIYYGSSENYSTTNFQIDKTYFASGWGFDSDNLTYSSSYTKFNIGGDDLIISHLYVLIPLLAFLILSLVFYGKGLVHLLTFAYTMVVAYMAVSGQWELLFMPVCVGTGIISILLFIYAMTKGDWL